MKRSVFFISDSTGITAETLGRSLLTQFPHLDSTNFSIEEIATKIITGKNLHR